MYKHCSKKRIIAALFLFLSHFLSTQTGAWAQSIFREGFRRRNLFKDQIQTDLGVLYVDPSSNLGSSKSFGTRSQYPDQIAIDTTHRLNREPVLFEWPQKGQNNRFQQVDTLPMNLHVKRAPFRDENDRFNGDKSFNNGHPFANHQYPDSLGSGSSQDSRIALPQCPADRDLMPCKCQQKGTEIHVRYVL